MLRLRKTEPADLPYLYQWENDAAAWTDGCNHNPISQQDLRNYLEQTTGDLYRDGQLRLIVDTAEDNDWLSVGCIDLFDLDPRNRRAAVGIYIAPPYRRQGYAREALSQLVQYAFSFLHLRLLYAFVATHNTASEHLFAAGGFEPSSILKDWTAESDARLWTKNTEHT